MDSKKSDICVFCHYARPRKDICGIYCAGAFWKKPDGTCDHFEDYAEHRNDAFDMAISALRQQDHFREVTKKVEPLTLDELIKRDDPVFVSIKDFPNGGYWCLCENGYIIPPSGHGFMAKERPNWVFYSQKLEEDDHDERKENENV